MIKPDFVIQHPSGNVKNAFQHFPWDLANINERETFFHPSIHICTILLESSLFAHMKNGVVKKL